MILWILGPFFCLEAKSAMDFAYEIKKKPQLVAEHEQDLQKDMKHGFSFRSLRDSLTGAVVHTH